MEKYTSSLRVILCANSTAKIIGPIRSRCLLLRVGAPTEEQVRAVSFSFPCLFACSLPLLLFLSETDPLFCQIDSVLQKTARAEELSVPPHVSLLISRISSGNLRRAILSLEALATQDPSFSSIKKDHSVLTTGKQAPGDIDSVPRPDWEKYAAQAAERILAKQSPEGLLEVRGMFYELLVHCLPAKLILSVRPLLSSLFERT
jgi:replication factor C subunit 3/5